MGLLAAFFPLAGLTITCGVRGPKCDNMDVSGRKGSNVSQAPNTA